ncbi:hypothetical protein FRB90_001979 [Tulasnella sp. 427]|nr:hypothetical protein FRB90_001979 [Tulasnella sp. 427]
MNISIPPPKPANQDNVLITQSRGHDPPPDNLARPCPHCLPNNEFGWRCPRPLADPTTDAEHAWNLDNGTPPGHAWCGSCDELHPLGAPSTTKCSVCETSFCGLSIPHLCVANGMSSAHLPVAVSNLTGMIQSLDVYDAFNGNTTEVELLFDWLREDGRGPRGILLSMIEKVRQSTGGFQALIDQGVFSHQPNDDAASDAPIPVLPPPPAPAAAVNEASAPVPEAEAEPQPQPQLDGNATDAAPAPAPPPPPPPPSFTRICRECCHELFFHRLYDWWAEERQAIVDAANAPPPPAPAAETQLEASLTAPPTEAAIAPPAGDPTAPPADALSDTDEDEDDDEDDEGESRPPSRSGGSRARVMLPEWATKPERRDCERGRACGDQHAPSHAREFNHVILVRPEPQPQPPAAGEREGEQATSTSTLPADAPVASGSPSAEAEADVEMVVVDGPAPPSSESSRVLKIEALLSNPAPTASTSTSSSSAVIKLDEDATMEDADSANVEHVLANVVASSSPPPAPVTGSSSVVVV